MQQQQQQQQQQNNKLYFVSSLHYNKKATQLLFRGCLISFLACPF